MNTNKKWSVKKIFCGVIITLAIFTTLPSNAQYSINGRWNIKAHYSAYNNIGLSYNESSSPVFQCEVNYGVLNFLEVGLYGGNGRIKTEEIFSIENDFSYSGGGRANALFYGLNANIHLLPFIIKAEKFRFDIYLSGKMGGLYYLTKENIYPAPGHVFDYGFYAGSAFYLGQHWGIFGEYGFGNHVKYRVGLSFKF